MDIYLAVNHLISPLDLSDATKRAYREGVKRFIDFNKYPKGFDTSGIKLEHFSNYLTYLKKTYAANSAALYATGTSIFLRMLVADDLSDINPEAIKLKKSQRVHTPDYRYPQFPIKDIEQILAYFENTLAPVTKDGNEKLRFLRDKALFLTLADTGMRIHEALKLIRSDVDLINGRALVIGKGSNQDVVRFSDRSIDAIRAYLDARSELDGGTHKPLATLPIFAGHYKSSGKRVRKITTQTARVITNYWVCRILGMSKKGTITPHSFRHYFVTVILQESGDLKLAQELARHKNIQVTQRYAHLLEGDMDKRYREIFNRSKR